MTVRTYKSGRVRLTGKHMQELRQAVYRRDGGRCRHCGIPVSDDLPDWHPQKYHLAHIRSRGAGGSDSIENTQVLCGEHHRAEHHGRL